MTTMWVIDKSDGTLLLNGLSRRPSAEPSRPGQDWLLNYMREHDAARGLNTTEGWFVREMTEAEYRQWYGQVDTALVLPRELTWVCGFDWGHNSPGVIGWAAVMDADGIRLHVVREWKFTGLADEEIAAGWKQRTKELGIQVLYVAGDPSMWIRDGRNAHRGQSRAETFIRSGMPLRKAQNARPDGWSRLHSFLRVPRDDQGNVTGAPLLTIDESCTYLRRTIPAQRSAKLDADDVDTKGDDHGVDMLRYLVMSRPNPMLIRQKEKRLNPMLEEALAGSSARSAIGADAVRRRG